MPKMVEDFENSQSSEVKYTIVGLVSLVGLLSLVAIYFEHIPDTCNIPANRYVLGRINTTWA